MHSYPISTINYGDAAEVLQSFRGILCSKLGPDTDYPDLGLSIFPQSLQSKSVRVTQSGNECFLPYPFWFIIHQSLYSVDTNSITRNHRHVCMAMYSELLPKLHSVIGLFVFSPGVDNNFHSTSFIPESASAFCLSFSALCRPIYSNLFLWHFQISQLMLETFNCLSAGIR